MAGADIPGKQRFLCWLFVKYLIRNAYFKYMSQNFINEM